MQSEPKANFPSSQAGRGSKRCAAIAAADWFYVAAALWSLKAMAAAGELRQEGAGSFVGTVHLPQIISRTVTSR
jgi:hypothetical protein